LFKLISVTLKASASLNILLFMSAIFKVAGNVLQLAEGGAFGAPTCQATIKV
jgi:hypothetical protein